MLYFLRKLANKNEILLNLKGLLNHRPDWHVLFQIYFTACLNLADSSNQIGELAGWESAWSRFPFLSQMLTNVYVSCPFLPQMIFAFLLFCCLQCVFTCYWSEMFSITLSCWANTVFLYWGLVDPIRSKFLHAFRKPDQTCSKSLQFLKSRN